MRKTVIAALTLTAAATLSGCGADVGCGTPEHPCFINPGGTTIYQQPTFRSTVTVTQRSASNPAPKPAPKPAAPTARTRS